MQVHSDANQHVCKCGKSYKLASSYRRHKHECAEQGGGSVCPVCGVQFHTIKGYKTHMLTHEEGYDPEKHKSKPPPADRKLFMCDQCGFQTHYLKSYKRHHALKHEHKQHLRCKTCHRIFDSTEMLEKHKKEKSHYFRRVYVPRHNRNVCNLCGRNMKTPAMLKEHINSHFKIKKNVCQMCNRAFIFKSNLTRHMRTNHEDKSFECPYCHKTYACKVSRFISTVIG